MSYKDKYLKYKNKYLTLKKQLGGTTGGAGGAGGSSESKGSEDIGGSVDLNTKIILPNTCLIRGKSKSDDKTNKRFFGYYGYERDIEKFCKSKNFVEKYAKDGIYEYYKVVKPIILVNFPYISLEEYSQEQLEIAANIAQSLINYIDHNTSETVNKYGQDKVKLDILKVLIPDDLMEEEITTDNIRNMNELYNKLKNDSADNPDYIMAKIICELGFSGWVREANDETYFSSDEIFICNITDLEPEYLIQSEECKLSNC